MDGLVTISGRQRNLLYKPTLDYLSVAGDIYLCAVHGRYEEADRLARQTCDELLFVLGDLGWRQRREDGVIAVVTPPLIVRRVVGRILNGARHEVFEGTEAEIGRLKERESELRFACEAVLGALPPEGAAR